MKIKTLELIDITLDWAVTKCKGIQDSEFVRTHMDAWPYSTVWSQGGPIIEQEGIDLYCNVPTNPAHKDPSWRGSWRARYSRCGYGTDMSHGPTPLIAAMRCYVASKLGAEVEIPNELIGE